ncbi:MAG: DUF429 domain-containing protein [Dehalococcoidia bacterium]
MTGPFVGIDLTTSAARPSACAVLDASLGVLRLDPLATEEEILRMVADCGAGIVAIDAPLGLPLGLCCLETACPCVPALGHKVRTAELALARRGIGCFFTTKRSIIKGLVERGMRLARELSARGCQVIEVYPYATKVELFGKRLPRKSTREGLAFLKVRLPELIPSLSTHMGTLEHNLCDALLGAYTVYLHSLGCSEALGIPEEGQIVIPAGYRRLSVSGPPC